MLRVNSKMMAAHSSTITAQDWLLTEEGQCIALELKRLELPEKPYRLYRFLTELEDILDTVKEDTERICQIMPLVRKLLSSSYWLQLAFTDPPFDPGWSVQFLYDEYDYPITVQMVAWLPGQPSPIHNHGTWGIVALVSGQEKNQFWRRSPTSQNPDAIDKIAEKLFQSGDMIGFLPDAIHSVEPMGDQPAITFNLYGETNYAQRFEYDPVSQIARNF